RAASRFEFTRNDLALILSRDDRALRRDHRRGLPAVGARLAPLAALGLAARLVVHPGLEEAGLLDLAGASARGNHALGAWQDDGRIVRHDHALLLVLLERAEFVQVALGAAWLVAAAADVAPLGRCRDHRLDGP